MLRKGIDENVAALEVEAVGSKQETIMSASTNVCIEKSSRARFVSGQVETGSRPGSCTVLSVAEEATIDGLLVYAGSHCLGLIRAQLGKPVRKLGNDGHLVL